MRSLIMQYFSFAHLVQGRMRRISTECATLAYSMDAQLPDNAEKRAGLRKLLEAKDCFVRAAIEKT